MHEERYRKLLKNVEDGVVFSRDGDMIWQCRNCGHIVVGKKAPLVCPVCNHPQSYFEIKKDKIIINFFFIFFPPIKILYEYKLRMNIKNYFYFYFIFDILKMV